MSFTQDDVKKLAYLARLEIDHDHSIVEDLGNILQLVGRISEINTDNIAPMAHTQNVSQGFRPDIVTEPNLREIMQNLVAPSSVASGLYLVPKVVE